MRHSSILVDLGIPDDDGRLTEYLRNPPNDDVVVRTLYKSPDDYFMVEASIVVCSASERSQSLGARKRPVHFRKTIKTSAPDAGPRTEFDKARELYKKMPSVVPEPISCDEHEIRSEYIPGISLRCLAIKFGLATPLKGDGPFKKRPPGEFDLHSLWRHAEQASSSLEQFHKNGYIHGNLHLENIIIAPGRAVLVDLKTARPSRGREDEENDFKNIVAFARKLIAAGAKPDEKSPLLQRVNNAQEQPLPGRTYQSHQHHAEVITV